MLFTAIAAYTYAENKLNIKSTLIEGWKTNKVNIAVIYNVAPIRIILIKNNWLHIYICSNCFTFFVLRSGDLCAWR